MDGPILVLQDMTEFSFTRTAPEKIGFTKTSAGRKEKDGRFRQHTLCGLLMHASLAVNHHAHVLTSTRRLEPEGFGAKTRVLDAARTGGPEIEVMRGLWSELQNSALERAGEAIRAPRDQARPRRERHGAP